MAEFAILENARTENTGTEIPKAMYQKMPELLNSKIVFWLYILF
jgi:hypothetical protein